MRDQLRLLTLCALHHETTGRIDWKLLARTAQTNAALDLWYAGEIQEQSPAAAKANRVMAWALDSPTALGAAQRFAERQMEAATAVGAHLVTVLDDDYPANLRLVPDAPPFLFYKGHLDAADARSIAVVGTRRASRDGLSRARRMAAGLSSEGIVVVSGLARGVDTAAHTATVELSNRTVAVTGTGIASPVYPKENTRLAERIVEARGAVVSQFWPTDPPDRWRFPARNITMSGFTQGTVVIEASSTSGAKMQAQAALAHAKTVFLLKSLATAQPWAQLMISDALQAYARGSFAHTTRILPAHDADLIMALSDHTEEPAEQALLPLPVVEVGDVADVIDRVATAEAIAAAADLRHRMASARTAAL